SYSVNSGLGPTKLISPFKILNNSGNSSKLEERKILPNFVILISFGNNSPLESTSFDILLNLYNLKRQFLKPVLSCVKIIGLPNLIFTNIATINNTGDNRIIKNNENIISNILFIKFLYKILPPIYSLLFLLWY